MHCRANINTSKSYGNIYPKDIPTHFPAFKPAPPSHIHKKHLLCVYICSPILVSGWGYQSLFIKTDCDTRLAAQQCSCLGVPAVTLWNLVPHCRSSGLPSTGINTRVTFESHTRTSSLPFILQSLLYLCSTPATCPKQCWEASPHHAAVWAERSIRASSQHIGWFWHKRAFNILS